ncbi:MAG: hypothetical protein H6642_16815 [Caldilineaceae bacterium]|nr:hypothetical protein [Caldilineaceae bacterium]MCB9140006.1 hypothetical protein [Caldilineaceae bacterium]
MTRESKGLCAGTATPWTNRQELHYAYDNNGNITGLTDARNSGPGAEIIRQVTHY